MPQTDIIQPDDLKDKAAAQARLAEVYVESGKKVEAEENLKATKDIYVMRGEQEEGCSTHMDGTTD